MTNPDPATTTANPEPCEHYFASEHQPSHRLYWVRRCMLCHAVDWGDLNQQVDEKLSEARADERQRIYDELGRDHYVIFTPDRWTVEHSVECRLSGHMHECTYHAAVVLVADDGPDPDLLGRWRIIGIDSEGLPSLERADLLDGDTP